ncbi:hypothetical protein CU560_01635 [Serratia ureilytica]|nr:hypothetical protein CU560_01635 [Serratia ureilytica]
MAESLPPLRFPADGEQAFHRDLKRAAHACLAGDHRYADAARLAKAALLLALCVGFYALSLLQHQPWAFFLCYFLFVTMGMLLNVNVNHDASHNFLRRPGQSAGGRLVTLPLASIRTTGARACGLPPRLRQRRTLRSGYRRERLFPPDTVPALAAHMRYQHLYWPLIAALSLPYIAWIFDCPIGSIKRRCGKTRAGGGGGWALFVLCKLAHLRWCWWRRWSWATCTASAGAGVAGLRAQPDVRLAAGGVLAAGHPLGAAEFYPAPTGDSMPKAGIGTISPPLRLAARTALAGASDRRAKLSPDPSPVSGWNHRHYPALAAAVAEVAQRHGMAYRCIGYRELLAQQQRFLRGWDNHETRASVSLSARRQWVAPRADAGCTALSGGPRRSPLRRRRHAGEGRAAAGAVRPVLRVEPAAAKRLAFFACYFGFIFIGMFLTVNVVHDASHNAFFPPLANRWLNALVSVPLGLDPDCWRVRHVLFHHAHNNIEHYDPDIDANGVLRQTPFQRWRPFMRAQRYYWPLVAALTFPYYIWLFDWLDRAGRTRVAARMAQQGVARWSGFRRGRRRTCCWRWRSHVGCCAGYRHPNSAGLFAEPDLFFIAVRDVDHRHPLAKANFYQAPAQGAMPHGWYHHVFATTFDWQTRPRWLGYWLGGANLHLTHHLFPH